MYIYIYHITTKLPLYVTLENTYTFFFAVLMFELRASRLPAGALPLNPHHQTFVVLGDGLTFFLRLAWTVIPYLYFPCVWNGRHEPPHPAIDGNGVSLSFCLGWLQNTIFLNSTLEVVGCN
jgi:hypothetical protein